MQERVEKVKEAIARLQLAWNDKNAYLWASAFTDSCDYINGSGHAFFSWSQEKNALHHERNWNSSYRNSHTTFELEKLDFPTDHLCIAIIKSKFTLHTPEGAVEHLYLITAVLEKQGIEWLIRNFQNTAVH